MTPDDPAQNPTQLQYEFWLRNYRSPYCQKKTPVLLFIVASTIGVFLAQLYYYYVLDSSRLTDLLAFSPAHFSNGSYWQIVTYAWIHAESFPGASIPLRWIPIHIITNMLMVWVLGVEVERTIGSFRFLVLYLGGVIAAGFTFWIFADSPDESVAGASGAAFALVTSMAVLYPKARLNVLFFFVIPMQLKMWVLAASICLIEVASLFLGWLATLNSMADYLFGWLNVISHTAHLGGAVFGLVATYLLRPTRPPARPSPFFPSQDL